MNDTHTMAIYRWLFLLPVLFLLTGCGGQAITPTETPIPAATWTATATITQTSTATPTATPTPTETPIPCFTLLEPADGAEIDRTTGQLIFAWTEQYGAAGYRFAITIPSGYVEEKALVDTSFERWLESLPMGGEYVWVVEAVDEAGDLLCTAGPFTFSKSVYVTPSNNTGASGGSTGGGGAVDSDGDGVPDENDLCPSEAGPVWNSGCPDGGGGQD